MTRLIFAPISVTSGVKRSDGTPLVVLPHDCRRVFASEHLNNNTPVHVIQALLGHATIDTVMVYAKLYPRNLVEEYRKAVRGLYNTFHGTDSLKNPTAEEWAAFERSCSMRDITPTHFSPPRKRTSATVVVEPTTRRKPTTSSYQTIESFRDAERFYPRWRTKASIAPNTLRG